MSRVLREWQTSCIEKALRHFQVNRHFFCQATPGAGKTRMAGELAKELLKKNVIDLVLCFAPSCQVVDGFRATFSKILGRRMDGYVGAIGDASTYQGMDTKGEEFWDLFEQYRILAIFDEIHHCAGYDLQSSNTWGATIISKIQNQATFTLSLSGTPWRTDDKAIALGRYSAPAGALTRDYHYGLQQAIDDKICRSPRITLVDNHNLQLTQKNQQSRLTSNYDSFAHLLESSPLCFEDILWNEDVIDHILDLGCRKLSKIRKGNPSAAGLIVASDTNHAKLIESKLKRRGENCRVVTSKTGSAQDKINEFRSGIGCWIVAVGMISEGTDIPRLQVCCYLSRIRTELHYRQVLGRILRRTGVNDDQAWLFVVAEPSLIEYSRRLSDDLPQDLAVISMQTVPRTQEKEALTVGENKGIDTWPILTADTGRPSKVDYLESAPNSHSSTSYELSVSSQFRAELLEIS
ncbi:MULTISPECIES: DEAD/DEAH box helicase [Pseudomonas]|uniref:DEAD/DEAH box helicase n=1 Tax=Pseudomonas TaxID=286 RepID=UPI001AECDCF7|nr:DEAD/DEAH box helicase family protein [Pseudomonas sp. PNP]MBP2838765.1 DEAD/DEAH box helicase family protein [Pseudomonas sp. PNP]